MCVCGGARGTAPTLGRAASRELVNLLLEGRHKALHITLPHHLERQADDELDTLHALSAVHIRASQNSWTLSMLIWNATAGFANHHVLELLMVSSRSLSAVSAIP